MELAAAVVWVAYRLPLPPWLGQYEAVGPVQRAENDMAVANHLGVTAGSRPEVLVASAVSAGIASPS